MLFRKIISKFLILIELILSIVLLFFWTLSYPLLRLRYNLTRKYKHLPSIVIFRGFVWAGSLFRNNYFEK
jgi:hypothetical protein